MLVLYAFFVFVSLSVAAIPLGGQSPHIRRISSIIPGISDLTKSLPVAGAAIPPEEIIQTLKPKLPIIRRFIMGADYASSSGPFLGKSSHKRQDPISNTLGSTTNGLTGDFPPKLPTSGSAPT